MNAIRVHHVHKDVMRNSLFYTIIYGNHIYICIKLSLKKRIPASQDVCVCDFHQASAFFRSWFALINKRALKVFLIVDVL
jgi:hypothetical protein